MDFEAEIQKLIGLEVSLPRKGYGSTIFLEIGTLSSVKTRRGLKEKGEACIAIEWDWRVEREGRVLFGSSNSNVEVARGIQSLMHCRIESIEISGNVPELEVVFSDKSCLRSMIMVTGDPGWSIRLLTGEWISSIDGKLSDENAVPYLTEGEKEAFLIAEAAAARWGVPERQPRGEACSECKYYAPIDGNGHLLDYGVCVNGGSTFDGRVVNFRSGCPEFFAKGL
ncbi:DUF3027 domain-containing protein [Hahella sp. CR1]|uniref:DUF3027 domain-containing protein n=1 Tax=Hahella sp. CR1 TaxID=2992807 RepID=UPI002440FDE0|nr:DUF3027 domain-containing protein [Hahella sp. CR1]MDG9670963.1 DUF3027 domain-containing protein [Hahella sp. CR1]